MPIAWIVIGAAALLYGLIVVVTLAWVRLANFEDLLILLLFRRVGKVPPQVSQYQGFF
jgi:hypothetical protein